MKERESSIQSAICDFLAYRKVFFWRSNNIPALNRNGDGTIEMRRLPKYTMRGLPDIMIVKDGQFVGLRAPKCLASAAMAIILGQSACQGLVGLQ